MSATLANPAWNNSTVLKGDVLNEVSTLKQHIDGDIVIAGSFQLVRTLSPRATDASSMPRLRGITGLRIRAQYSPLITKKEPRITPASFDFWRANLKRDSSSSGTSMPSESLNPTARFSPSLMPYITLIDRPDS